MQHLRNVFIGIVFGCIYWLMASLLSVSAGNEDKEIYISSLEPKVNYANTISYKIKAEKVKEYSLEDNLLLSEGYTGTASYYGRAFAGRTTACGDVFDPNLRTAASLRHRCGTRLRVCSLDSDRCVDIVVNDRGPYIEGRALDLAEAAFAELAPLSQGLLEVEITELK